VRHSKVVQETRTAEDAEVISLRLGGLNVCEPSRPKLSAPCVNAPLRTLLSFCLPCWKR
jgi:hypothetical protein